MAKRDKSTSGNNRKSVSWEHELSRGICKSSHDWYVYDEAAQVGEKLVAMVDTEEHARLVSAANELLAVCEEAYECLRVMGAHEGGLGSRLHEAITKARQ